MMKDACVVGTLTRVELALSGIRLPFGYVDTYFEDLIAQSLRQVLTFVSIHNVFLSSLLVSSLYSVNNASSVMVKYAVSVWCCCGD